MAQVFYWSLRRLIETIITTLKNDFDCILFIEGQRGLGKSTMAYQIARAVKPQIHPEGKKFSPKKDIFFKREDVMKNLAIRKHDIIFADEMINVSFKRDFYLEDQKQLMKMLDMYRDSCNLFIGCVPMFSSLDKHLRDLVKIRITVVRRGIALIHTQRKSIFTSDRWDTVNNERIERKWKSRPQYAQLTTFRGMVKFPDLRDASKKLYREVKEQKRNILFADPEHVKDKKDVYQNLMDNLVKGEITKEEILKFSKLMGINYETIRNTMRAKLNESGIKTRLNDLYAEAEEKELKKMAPKIKKIQPAAYV